MQYYLDVQESQLKAGQMPGTQDFGVDPHSNCGRITTIQDDGEPKREIYHTVEPATYGEFYRRFAKALKGQGEVPVKAEDAREVLRIIDMALLSSKEGRTIVV